MFISSGTAKTTTVSLICGLISLSSGEKLLLFIKISYSNVFDNSFEPDISTVVLLGLCSFLYNVCWASRFNGNNPSKLPVIVGSNVFNFMISFIYTARFK